MVQLAAYQGNQVLCQRLQKDLHEIDVKVKRNPLHHYTLNARTMGSHQPPHI